MGKPKEDDGDFFAVFISSDRLTLKTVATAMAVCTGNLTASVTMLRQAAVLFLLP